MHVLIQVDVTMTFFSVPIFLFSYYVKDEAVIFSRIGMYVGAAMWLIEFVDLLLMLSSLRRDRIHV